MTLQLANRVAETSVTTGTNDFELAGALTNFRTFSDFMSDGDKTYYVAVLDDEWESGIGTYVSATGKLARTTVLSSSNSNNKVSFSAGTKTVLCSWTTEVNDGFYPRVDGANTGPLAGFRNYLINGDFSINQRAFAGGSLSAGEYGFDRWKADTGGASVAVSGDTVTLTSGTIVQVIESPRLASRVVTISVEDPSGTISVDIESETGSITSGSGRRGLSLTIPSASTGNITVKLSATSVTFKRVQLEIGDLVDIGCSEFEYRPVGVEEGLAQRYYFRATSPKDLQHYRYSSTASTAWAAGLIRFPVDMRTSPSATIVTAPTYNGCSGLAFAIGPQEAAARVTTTGTAAYRATSGVYEFDAEL